MVGKAGSLRRMMSSPYDHSLGAALRALLNLFGMTKFIQRMKYDEISERIMHSRVACFFKERGLSAPMAENQG